MGLIGGGYFLGSYYLIHQGILANFDWFLVPFAGFTITVFLLPVAHYLWLLQAYRYVRKHPDELVGKLIVSYRYTLRQAAEQIGLLAGLPVLLICLFDTHNSFAFGCLVGICASYLRLFFVERRVPHTSAKDSRATILKEEQNNRV